VYKAIKKSFVELVRINLRESICDSARNCFCFVNYSPQTSLHNQKHLSFEFDSGRPNLGCFFEIIYNAFTSDWGSSLSTNLDALTRLSMAALKIGYRPSESQNSKVGCFKAIAATTYQAESQWLRMHRPKHDLQVREMIFSGVYPFLSSVFTHTLFIIQGPFLPHLPSQRNEQPWTIYHQITGSWSNLRRYYKTGRYQPR
jgi:hypothetical protein